MKKHSLTQLTWKNLLNNIPKKKIYIFDSAQQSKLNFNFIDLHGYSVLCNYLATATSIDETIVKALIKEGNSLFYVIFEASHRKDITEELIKILVEAAVSEPRGTQISYLETYQMLNEFMFRLENKQDV